MTEPRCPSCKAQINYVRPVRIPSASDSLRWEGREPTTLGFVCPQCGVLLPLSPTPERDDP